MVREGGPMPQLDDIKKHPELKDKDEYEKQLEKYQRAFERVGG